MKKLKWQRELISSIRDLKELCSHLELDYEESSRLLNLNPLFPLLVPQAFLRKIKKGDLNDPILKQILPLIEEKNDDSNFSIDPVDDLKHQDKSGLIHKYKNRVLLPLSGACAVHCRYCFRQHFPYETARFNQDRFAKQLNYIESHHEINEVILSGGDPLSLPDKQLDFIFSKLSSIDRIQCIRIHSRFPVVIPCRINSSFLSLFDARKVKFVFVYHINHSNEICSDLARGAAKLRKRGLFLLNQSVLLKGINDDVNTLKKLSEDLFSIGILPYYINQLDRVKAASHFEVTLDAGKKALSDLRKELSGYLVPKYVQDIKNEPNKRLIL